LATKEFIHSLFFSHASPAVSHRHGEIVPFNGAVVKQAFGRFSFGQVIGLLRPATLPILGTAAPFAGWVYDYTGNYLLAYEVFFAAWLLVAVSISLVKLPDLRR